MSSWRLLGLETHNASMNMAVDEAVLTARISESVPNTVRFYRWLPSAVSVGKFQNVENEVNVVNCQKSGLDIVRRISGGGTVYHDSEGEITYSVVVHKRDLGTEDIAAVYSRVCHGLIEALRILGVTSEFNEGDARKCPNLTVNGKKISGSAQSHKQGVVLQHGTFLVDVDLERMFSFLRPSVNRTCLDLLNSARNKITSLKDELGRTISINEVVAALTQGFAATFNSNLAVSGLTVGEQISAKRLFAEKYSTSEWNFHGAMQQ